MAGNPLKLFLDRFMLCNKERYKNDPAAMNVLNNMTLEQINFNNWRVGQVGNATQMTVDMEVPKRLEAIDQQYFPLDFASPLVMTPTDATPVLESDLPQKGTGVYYYNDTTVTPNRLAVAVVVRVKDDLIDEAIVVVKAACKFDLEPGELSPVSDSQLSVQTKTFVDVIKVLASEVTVFLYDGTLLYDGTATY